MDGMETGGEASCERTRRKWRDGVLRPLCEGLGADAVASEARCCCPLGFSEPAFALGTAGDPPPNIEVNMLVIATVCQSPGSLCSRCTLLCRGGEGPSYTCRARQSWLALVVALGPTVGHVPWFTTCVYVQLTSTAPFGTGNCTPRLVRKGKGLPTLIPFRSPQKRPRVLWFQGGLPLARVLMPPAHFLLFPRRKSVRQVFVPCVSTVHAKSAQVHGEVSVLRAFKCASKDVESIRRAIRCTPGVFIPRTEEEHCYGQ